MDSRLEKLFLDFLKGRTNLAEESELLGMINEDRSVITDLLELETEEAESTMPSFEQRMSFASLMRKMRRSHFRKGVFHAIPVFAAAAAAALLIVTGHPRQAGTPDKACVTVVSTAVGERRTVELPDGTTVTLNSATSLSYNEDFVNSRNVTLSGEAYFDVRSDPHHPFSVSAKNSSIKVLGTKFNVEAYDGENLLQAALVEGKIQFHNAETKMDIIPGEVLTCRSNSISKCKDDVSKYLSWMEGKLVYDRITLDDLLARLSSCYGVKIAYSPIKYADYTFRISLNTNESIDSILDAVSILTPIQWTHKDGYISIKEIQ